MPFGIDRADGQGFNDRLGVSWQIISTVLGSFRQACTGRREVR